MPFDDVIDAVNSGPFGSTVTNFAAVRKAGAVLNCAGEKDFTKSNPEEISGTTMFCEGSIGKVRYAGMAYMLQEEGVIDLQKNAKEFFASKQVGKFLEKKYPEQAVALQTEIGKLFSGDSDVATLADLTTHRSGIGDLTRDQARLIGAKGVGYEFSTPELLLIPEEHRLIPRNEAGKPRAQSDPKTLDENLPDAKYGNHEYSNLGYMLLGLAMEAAYDAAKNPNDEKEIKNYKQLTRDYMLHPTEGPAVGKDLSFDETKFPEDLEKTDDVARSSWLEKGKLVDATQFSGANAAGGMLASADDSTKFFDEFFAGFSSTSTRENKFFSAETIKKMKQEGQKFPACGANKDKGTIDFQCPGFVEEVDQASGDVLSYKKGGGTFGYASLLRFDAKENHTVIEMCAQENLTGEVAKKLGVENGDVFVGESANEIAKERCEKTKNVVEKYCDSESGKLNRRKMIVSEMPTVATQIVVRDLNDHGLSVADAVTSHTNIPKVEGGKQSRGL